MVAAVIEFATERKYTEINMRDIAQMLGVSAKLLYNYVKSKDELLDLAAAAILQSWEPPCATLHWRQRLNAILLSTRALVRQYPALSQAILLRNLEARDSPEVAKIVALIKACFRDAGLHEDEVQQIFLIYEALVLGELTMLEAERTGKLSAANMPNRVELDASFELSLTCTIEGLKARRP